jgi:hypothetical protein
MQIMNRDEPLALISVNNPFGLWLQRTEERPRVWRCLRPTCPNKTVLFE